MNLKLGNLQRARASPNNFIQSILGNIFLKAFICLVFFSGIYLFSAGSVSAATLYWVGADAANTSVASNWKTTNPAGCGSGDAGAAPGSSDIATFDPDCDNGATVDSALNVAGINIVSGYTGTITVNAGVTVGSSSFIRADGIWTGNAQTFDINDGSFTVSGGTHTATTGTWTVERDFTSSGGTLTMTGATVVIDGTGSGDSTIITCTGTLGGSVDINGKGGAFVGNVTLSSGCTITATRVSISRGSLTNNGTINHTGSTFDVNGASTNEGSVTNNTGATITYSGTDITLEGNLTQSGTWDLSGKTITFDGGSDDSIVTCSGSLGGSVSIAKTGGGDFTNSSGCTLTVTSINSTRIGTLTNNGTINHTGTTFNLDDATSGGNLTNNSGATITYSGTDITIEGNLTQSGTWDLSGKTITFDGGGTSDDTILTCSGSLGGTVTLAQTGANDFTLASGCTITVNSISGTFGLITVDGTLNHTGSTFNMDHGDACVPDCGTGNLVISSTGTITYSGTDITLEGNFTQSGTFDLTGITVTFDGTGDTDDSTLTCGSSSGFNLTINKTSTSGTFDLGGNCTVNNFTRTDGVFNNPGCSSIYY